MDRRAFLLFAAASCAQPSTGGRAPFRYAICNETFVDAEFSRACAEARAAGFTGIEIAPFTLSDDPATLSPKSRASVRSALAAEGLEFVGLHWLLRAPEGLHVTTPDDALRARSWAYVRRLVDLCGDFGNRGVMVFGSGKSRSATGGASHADAVARFTDGLAGVAPHAAARGVTILIEPLGRPYSDILNTVPEAAAVVRRIGSPAIRTMVDCRQSEVASVSASDAVREHASLIRHVHVNEKDGRHPGTGSFDFPGLFAALRDVGYGGWLSVEVFRFDADGPRIARESMRALRDAEVRS